MRLVEKRVLLGLFGVTQLFLFNTSSSWLLALFVNLFVGGTAWLLYPRFQLYWIPGPPQRLFIGNLTPDVARSQHLFHEKLAAEYGPVVRVLNGRIPIVLVNDPDLVKEVLSKNFRDFHDRPMPAFDARFTKTKHLLVQRGEEWRSSRRALSASFHIANLRAFAADINRGAERFITRLDKLRPGQTVNVTRFFETLVIEVLSATSFGETIDQSARDGQSIADACLNIGKGASTAANKGVLVAQWFPIIAPYLKYLPVKKFQDIRDSYDLLAEKVLELVKKMKKTKPKTPNFLWLLINAKDKETGKTLSEREIVDQARLFILAGYETSSISLSYITYQLAKHPDCERRLLEEIDQLSVGDEMATYDDLRKYKYLDWIISEVMRVMPAGANFNRYCIKDTKIGEYFVPKGTTILIPQWVLHRDERYFKDPLTFRPERWDPDGDEYGKHHNYSYLPFGAGHRKCIGYQFALEELKLLLINIYRHYTFQLAAETDQKLKLVCSTVILMPQDGVTLKVMPRSKSLK